MEFTAEQIAGLIEGTVEGNTSATVNNVSKIEEGVPGTLSFLANPKYAKYIYDSKASIIIVNDSFKAEKKVNATLIRVKDAYIAFAKLLEIYSSLTDKKPEISSAAVIDDTAQLGEDVYIGAFTVIGKNAKINSKLLNNILFLLLAQPILQNYPCNYISIF